MEQDAKLQVLYTWKVNSAAFGFPYALKQVMYVVQRISAFVIKDH